MRETGYILLALLITWLTIFFIVPAAGFDAKLWQLIVSASIGGIFAGLLVLLGESVIEAIVKLVILLVLSGILAGSKPGFGFIFVSALISGVTGAVINQINQYVKK